MDQYPPATNNTPSSPKPNRLHNLAFWKVGLIEIFIVVFGLLTIFGTLNYFNLLPVSDAFPQLGWLPRQTIKQLASPTGGFNNLAIKQNTIPSPTLSQPPTKTLTQQ